MCWVAGLFGVLRFSSISTCEGEQEGCDNAELEGREMVDRALVAYLWGYTRAFVYCGCWTFGVARGLE